MGLTPVADDELATIVTTLEMTARPLPRPLPASPLRLVRWGAPEPAKYRELFRRVGSPWLWYSRLAMGEETLAATIAKPAVEVYAAVDRQGIEVGMLELDFGGGETARIAYFGLVPELAGRGHGGWMMAEAMARLWRPGVERVVVDTCTLDHPRALGLLPADAAPQIPYLAASRR